MNLFADSSGWVALFNPRDKYHVQTKQTARESFAVGDQFVTTDYVLDETITNLQSIVNHSVAERFAVWVMKQEHITIARISEEIWNESLALFQKYDDKDFSFTDCTSFVVMRRMSISEAFAFDHHFEQMGFRLWPR